MPKVKQLLEDVRQDLEDANWHDAASIFGGAQDLPNIESMSLNDFLKWVKQNWDKL